jgi:hypothetical protein
LAPVFFGIGIVFIIIGRLSQMNMKAYMLVSQIFVAPAYFALCAFVSSFSSIHGLLTIIVCLIILFVFFKNNDKSDFLPISLIVFGSLVAASITVGRVGFGFRQALESRYTSYTLDIVIGICLFIFNKRKRLSSFFYKAIIAVVVFSLAITYVSSLKNEMVQFRDFRRQNMAILMDYKNRTDEELMRLYPNAGTVIRSARVMEQQRLGPFKDPYKTMEREP